ncbi:MAG: helix-turn-helix transcriptional regulator, partial [Desulfobacterales bacterium]|nr:helix-turn-helix transcriptional regulator [Desulfobacterales bacterium]
MQIQKPSDLARILKTRRQAKGLTQQEVADDVGITRQSLARIERGHGGVSFDTVLRIFETLDIRLETATSNQRNLTSPIFDDGGVQRSVSDALIASQDIDTSALAAA